MADSWYETYPEASWYDSFPLYQASMAPVTSRFREGPPGSGGRPPPRPDQTKLPPLSPYLAGSIEGIREIPGDIYRGVKEEITEYPERAAAGYQSVNRDAPGAMGVFNRVIGAPAAEAYNAALGGPAGQAAFDIGASGGVLPSSRGIRGLKNEPVRSVERDFRPSESETGNVQKLAVPAPKQATQSQATAIGKAVEGTSSSTALPQYPPKSRLPPPPAEEQATFEKFLSMGYQDPNQASRRAKFGAAFDPQQVASGNMLSAASGPPPSAPGAKATHANVIEQEMEHYKLANREQLRRTEVRKTLESRPSELTPEVEQKLYAHAENDFSAGRLTPQEETLYENHIEPWLERNKEIFKEIRSKGKALGIEDSEIEELHPGYMHRMVQGKTRDLDRAAGFEAHDPGTGASKGFGGTYQAPATKSRTYYAIVNKEGARRIVHIENGHVYDAKTGNLIKSRHALGEGFSPKVGARFTADGKTWAFAHAKTSEIEANTETRYIKSASASVLNNYLELERMRGRLALVQRTQEKFIHEGKATRNVKTAQEHKWIASKFPGMEGVYMDKRLAAAMDKFAPKVAEENLADYLVRAENFLNSTLFWNPLPHARNVFMHALIERGWDNFKPWTYPQAALDAKRALTDVSTNSSLYQEVQKTGAATMFPRVANRDVFQKMVEGFEAPQNKSALKSLADKLSMPVKDLHNLVYVKFAQQALWFSNDMAIMQRVREKLRRVPGMTVAKAIEELHKDIPDYRIPSEVLFPGKPGRLVSQTIAGRYTNLFLRFTRFHYSVAKTFIYPAADIVKGISKVKDPLARAEAINAVGKLISLAVSYELMNVVGNKAMQGLTGDEKARIAMWGPLAYVRLIDDIVSGRVKDEASFIKAATAGLFSMSPLIEVGLQALGINYRLQPDYGYRKASPAGKALAIAGQGVAPISQAKKYYERGPGFFAADVTVGAGRTPMTDTEYKAFKKTPEYKLVHPRKPRVQHEDAASP